MPELVVAHVCGTGKGCGEANADIVLPKEIVVAKHLRYGIHCVCCLTVHAWFLTRIDPAKWAATTNTDATNTNADGAS